MGRVPFGPWTISWGEDVDVADEVITNPAPVIVNIRNAAGRFRADVQETIDEAQHGTLTRDRRAEAKRFHKMFALRIVHTLIEERGGRQSCRD
jgi:hypothetical protein